MPNNVYSPNDELDDLYQQYEAVNQQHRLELSALNKVTLKRQLADLEGKITRAESKVNNLHHAISLPNDLMQSYRFDLNDLIETLDDQLVDREGLVGFGMSYICDSFPKNLCERLKHQRNREVCTIKEPISVDRRIRPPEKAVDIMQKYSVDLKKGEVLVVVKFTEQNLIAPFWKGLQQKISPKLANRFIIVMTVVSCDWSVIEGDECENIISLDSPVFERKHITQWVSEVVRHLVWHEVKDEWVRKMHEQCSSDNKVVIELVYSHIQRIADFLRLEQPDVHTFRRELCDWG